MSKFVVEAVADLTFEIEATNEEEAKALIAEAFKLNAPYDPLANVKFHVGQHYAELKTTVIQDWSVADMEVKEA